MTRIDPLQDFHPAEDYHQDFMMKNPQYPYIVVHDAPKVQNLQRAFPDSYRQPTAAAKGAGTL